MFLIKAEDKYSFYYCLEAYLEKVPPSRQILQAFEMYKRWNFSYLYLETNTFQGVMKHSYLDIQEKMPRGSLRVIGIDQYQNKTRRISSLEPLITNGHLLFAENLNPRFITQLELFPTSHDDGPDALYGAVEQLRRRPGSVRVLKEGCLIR